MSDKLVDGIAIVEFYDNEINDITVFADYCADTFLEDEIRIEIEEGDYIEKYMNKKIGIVFSIHSSGTGFYDDDPETTAEIHNIYIICDDLKKYYEDDE
jgi:hypothetical protein